MGNLHYEIEVGGRRRRATTRSVLSQGITAKLPPGLGDPEWVNDLEYVWRARTYADVQSLNGRARRLRKELRSIEAPEAYETSCVWTLARRRATRQQERRLRRSIAWAESRARAMAMKRAEVLASCGGRKRKVRCGCGVFEVDVGCDQTSLCDRCRKRHMRKWRRRIVRAMDAHLRAAVASWNRSRSGYKPGIYLDRKSVV